MERISEDRQCAACRWQAQGMCLHSESAMVGAAGEVVPMPSGVARQRDHTIVGVEVGCGSSGRLWERRA